MLLFVSCVEKQKEPAQKIFAGFFNVKKESKTARQLNFAVDEILYHRRADTKETRWL